MFILILSVIRSRYKIKIWKDKGPEGDIGELEFEASIKES